MKKLILMLAMMLPMVLVSCSDDDGVNSNSDIKVENLPEMENVSLNYHPSEQTLTLARNVEDEGCEAYLKDDSYWITKLSLNGDKITFGVLENQDIETGHRFDTIVISYKGERKGTICVTQARKTISPERLVWATSKALYRDKALCESDMSGLEITRAIYNLEKTTNGQDSYKNYPAFAYCIEMNHDPENNMEWHLPSIDEMKSYVNGQSYIGTPFDQHNYWWSATENTLTGDDAFNLYSQSAVSRGAVSKGGDWWVMAFRNGKLEE